MKKRPIILIVIIILVVIGGLVALIVQRSSSNGEEDTPPASVQVTGTGTSTRLDPADDDDIVQKGVQAMVRLNEPEATGSFSSIVRKNSIVRSTASNGQPNLRYLVDVPELQRSFVVEREGDLSSDYATLYVVCPSASELKYPEKPCKVE